MYSINEISAGTIFLSRLRALILAQTNTKDIQEATYFDNGVANIKSRFMRVFTQYHSLGFLAVDEQII